MACAALVHNSPLSKGFMAGYRRGAAGGGWPCGSFPTFFTGLSAACECVKVVYSQWASSEPSVHVAAVCTVGYTCEP